MGIDLTYIFNELADVGSKKQFCLSLYISNEPQRRIQSQGKTVFLLYSNISLTRVVFPVEFSLVPLLWYPSNIARLKILTMQETCYLFHSYKIST